MFVPIKMKKKRLKLRKEEKNRLVRTTMKVILQFMFAVLIRHQ